MLVAGGTVALGGGPIVVAAAAGGASLGAKVLLSTDETNSKGEATLNNDNTSKDVGSLISKATDEIVGKETVNASFMDKVFRLLISMTVLFLSILTVFYSVRGIFRYRNTIFPTIGRVIRNLFAKIPFPKKGRNKKQKALNKSGTKKSSRR